MKYRGLLLLLLVIGGVQGTLDKTKCKADLKLIETSLSRAKVYWNSLVYYKEAIQNMGIMLTNIGLMLEDCDFLSLYANSPNIPLALHNLQKLDVRFLTHKPLNLNLQEESSSSCFEYALELADIIQKMAYPENDYELIDAIYEFAGITNKILNNCIL